MAEEDILKVLQEKGAKIIRTQLKKKCWPSSAPNSTSGSFFVGVQQPKNQNNELIEESRILKVVQNHENVLSYLTSLLLDTKRIVYMDMWNCTLECYLRSNKIEPEKFLVYNPNLLNANNQASNYQKRVKINLLKQIALGLNHLHSSDIIHCNIKSSNIFLSTTMQNKIVAKLGGLEFCKPRGADDLQQRGNDSYTASELFEENGAHKRDKKSDIFALGILFFYILTEQHPFDKNPQ